MLLSVAEEYDADSRVLNTVGKLDEMCYHLADTDPNKNITLRCVSSEMTFGTMHFQEVNFCMCAVGT